MTCHIDSLPWPSTWQTNSIGHIKWALYAKSKHPLSKISKLTENLVSDYPFVYPIYWSRAGLLYGNDHCPIKRDNRILGLGTATADAALAVVKESQQLAFLPEILCREDVNNKKVIELKVENWKTILRPVFLSVRSELVKNLDNEKLVMAMKEILRE